MDASFVLQKKLLQFFQTKNYKLLGMCRIATLPDTGYPANLTYRIPDSSTKPKLIF